MQHSLRVRRRAARHRRIRRAILASFLAATLVFGLVTPGQEYSVLDRVAVIGFCISVMMSSVMGVVMIPSPSDPRDNSRGMLPGFGRRAEEDEQQQGSSLSDMDIDSVSQRGAPR